MRGQGITIEVQVDTLISTLEKNRAKHEREYEKAKVGYQKLLLRELETKIKVLGKRPRNEIKVHSVNGQSEADLARIVNQKPVHYLGEYDEAIEMLRFATNSTIELDQEQFSCYIKDEWSWKRNWATSNTAYAAAAR